MATHVNELLRLMVRAFHGPECGVVFDALLRANRCIKDDEMAASLKLQQKQVRKYLFQLKQDHIVTYENRNKEALNKGERSSAHLHWFVDYKNAVDCIKYRLHQISKRLNEEKDREMQVQMYECRQCRYNALDAALLAINGWRCDRCIGEVEEVEAAASASQTVNLAKTMWAQLKPITEAMKRVEAHPIPKFPKTAAGAVLAGMEDEGMLISTRSMSGGVTGGSGLGPAPSASSSSAQSRANPAGGAVVNGGQVNVFVDIVGAQGGITGTTSGNQPPPKAPPKPAVPWLQASSSTTTTSNTPTQTTTTNSNANAPDEMDQATYEQYVKQYMEEYQKQVQLQQRATSTKQKANGGVKEEPNGADVAQAEKRRRVDEEEIKVEIQRDEIKQEPEPEPIIEFESEPSSAPAVEEPMVQIGDQQIPISHITDEHQGQMSEAEYEAYYKIYMDYYAEHQ